MYTRLYIRRYIKYASKQEGATQPGFWKFAGACYVFACLHVHAKTCTCGMALGNYMQACTVYYVSACHITSHTHWCRSAVTDIGAFAPRDYTLGKPTQHYLCEPQTYCLSSYCTQRHEYSNTLVFCSFPRSWFDVWSMAIHQASNISHHHVSCIWTTAKEIIPSLHV